MSLSDFFTAGKVPSALVGRTLVIAEPQTLMNAEPFLARLEQKHGPLALGVVGEADYAGPREHLALPAAHGADRKRVRKLRPKRVIVIGRADARTGLIAEAGAPSYWINAVDGQAARAGCAVVTVASPEQAARIPGAMFLGDPLLGLETLPDITLSTEPCERFKEYRERNHWVFYVAGSGEAEEAVAYGVLFELLRHSTAIMLLAPRDPSRLERVYHDALKYNLPTIRHSRLYTSCVPKKNRVYYVEDPDALDAFYPCGDVVIAGGTLSPGSSARPDLLTPLLAGRPVLVGPRRDDALVSAAVEAGVVLSAPDVEGLADLTRGLLTDAARGQALGEAARTWLNAQIGATKRVLDRLD